MKKQKLKEYCDWKYILMFILWTAVCFVDFADCPEETTLGGAFILLILWIIVSFWIVEQGKKHSQNWRKEKNG